MMRSGNLLEFYRGRVGMAWGSSLGYAPSIRITRSAYERGKVFDLQESQVEGRNDSEIHAFDPSNGARL
jgi:hypothetical protein